MLCHCKSWAWDNSDCLILCFQTFFLFKVGWPWHNVRLPFLVSVLTYVFVKSSSFLYLYNFLSPCLRALSTCAYILQLMFWEMLGLFRSIQEIFGTQDHLRILPPITNPGCYRPNRLKARKRDLRVSRHHPAQTYDGEKCPKKKRFSTLNLKWIYLNPNERLLFERGEGVFSWSWT